MNDKTNSERIAQVANDSSKDGGADRPEAGVSLILVLGFLTLFAMVAASMLFTSEVELKTSNAYVDQSAALNDTDSALEEVLWRLGLPAIAATVPGGSLVTINSLVKYDARINVDPQNILGNGVDDDKDGFVDEADELDLARDWQLRILLTASVPSASTWIVNDTSIATGPPWGSRLVAPTIQPSATWRQYSTTDSASADALQLRFARDDLDYAFGDTENDGPEIIFYDEDLVTNGIDDKNSLNGLGGDGNAANDSPYNITWAGGGKIYPASGSPVLVAAVTGRITRSSRQVGRRKVEARILPPLYAAAPVSGAAPASPASSIQTRVLNWRETS